MWWLSVCIEHEAAYMEEAWQSQGDDDPISDVRVGSIDALQAAVSV